MSRIPSAVQHMRVLGWLCVLLLWSWSGAQSLPKEIRERIIQATVMLLPADKDGKLEGSLGSGAMISPLGYILTNYHVVGDPDDRTLAPWIQVRTMRFADREPEFTYWGKVIAGDPNLDLAIVQIVEDKNEKAVGRLNLPFVELGDSNSLLIGDDIFVFGFQGTGGMTLSFSRGSVGGFTGDDLESSGRQWIKHDAQTGPGNSGGGAFDDRGALIGVHTAGVAGNNNSRTSFLRPLAVGLSVILPNVTGFAVKKGGAAPSPSPSPTPSPTPAPSPSPSASVNLSTGQKWSANFGSAGTYAVTLTKPDPEGGFAGTAARGSESNSAFMELLDGELLLIVQRADKSFLVCSADGSRLSATVRGDGTTHKNSSDKGTSVGACTLSLGGAAPAPTPAPATLSWPPSLAAGQKWTVNFGSVGSFTAQLVKTNDNGDFVGTATRGSESGTVIMNFSDDELTVLVLRNDNTFLVCTVERSGLSGATLRGDGSTHKNSSDPGTSVGACSMSR